MSSNWPTEIEAKLVVISTDREAVFSELREVSSFAGLAARPFSERFLTDRYFDLPNAQLASHGCALRLRRQAEGEVVRTIMTFKGALRSETGLGTERAEIEAEWSAEIMLEIIAELREMGIHVVDASLTANQTPRDALAELGFSLIQQRQTKRLATDLDRGAGPVAELALDHVTYGSGPVRIDHYELEVEALGGTDATEVNRIATELLHGRPGDLRPWKLSKTAVGRALEELQAEDGLGEVLTGNQLSSAGYDLLERRLA
ncbi:MAG: inorganic triphosphatase YgiF [Planctomycetota bacterium]|jgi:inorganic triphosphatase YgiF